MLPKLLTSWEFWTMIAIFLVSVCISLNIENLLDQKDSLYPALSFIPAVIAFYFIFVKNKK